MSAQRAAVLQSRFADGDAALRPILTFLNGDNSWLISFPRPVAERSAAGKVFYHVVYDPWLVEPATTFSPWLASIELAAAASVRGGGDVDGIVREIEDAAAAAGLAGGGGGSGSGSGSSGGAATAGVGPLVDAIFVHCDISDHNHEPTLRTFDAAIPVFASRDSIGRVRGYDHFADVRPMPELVPGDGSWRGLHPGAPLPGWLGLVRLVGNRELNFATALIWDSGAEAPEMLLYSPHGIHVEHPSFQTLARQLTPAVTTLAMMFSLKDSFAWGMRQTLGVDEALPVARQLRPKHWIVTADSLLQYSGLILKGVRDTPRTLASALEKEKNAPTTEVDRAFSVPDPLELENGACIFLDL